MATSHCQPGMGELANVLRDFGSFPSRLCSITVVTFLKCHGSYSSLQARTEGTHFLVKMATDKQNTSHKKKKTTNPKKQKQEKKRVLTIFRKYAWKKQNNKTNKTFDPFWIRTSLLVKRQYELLKPQVGSSPVIATVRESLLYLHLQ